MRIAFTILIFVVFAYSIQSTAQNESSDEEGIPEFKDLKYQAGLNPPVRLGQSAVWGDYNADGWLDILITNINRGSRRSDGRRSRFRARGALNLDTGNKSMFLFAGRSDGGFDEISSISELPDVNSSAASWADYNNDGFPDLAISTISTESPPLLFENKDGIFFADVTEASGLKNPKSSVSHVLWADFDRDGMVDLFQAGRGESVLYRNKGDGSFEDVSDSMSLAEGINTSSAVWFDYNNDGYPDIFLANSGLNKLYVNNGDGTLSDVTTKSGLGGEFYWKTAAACTGDYNGDGFLDIYVTNIGKAKSNALYRNNGDGTFEDVTWETNTGDAGDGRTCAWVDFDADGKIDLFTTNHVKPTKLYRNLGNGTFSDVAPEAGVDSPIDVFAATWGDYDRDGFMDVYLNGHIGTALMRNSGNSNSSVTLELVGDGLLSNSLAIGARVEVSTPDGLQIREVSGGRGCCEQDMLPVYFGAGKHTEVDINVKWPSGKNCSFEKVPVEKRKWFTIREINCEIIASN
ncbi:MAG: CRTAC1 family protein [Deltaproteobacteria bacterium]